MVTATRMTLEAFLAREDIDERRLELIDGEVQERVSPTWDHGNVTGAFWLLLRAFGQAGIEPRAIIPPSGDRDGSAPVPDAAFYRDRRPDDWMRTPPHVAIEVRSPGQSRAELRAKVDLYLAFGVESVWLADPERLEIEIYEGGEHRVLGLDDELTSSAVPGLSITVRAVYQDARVIDQ